MLRTIRLLRSASALTMLAVLALHAQSRATGAADTVLRIDGDIPLRIIVEGEGRPARWIRQLTALHVRRAPDDSTAH